MFQLTGMHNTTVFCATLRHGQPVGMYRDFRNMLKSTNSGRKIMGRNGSRSPGLGLSTRRRYFVWVPPCPPTPEVPVYSQTLPNRQT